MNESYSSLAIVEALNLNEIAISGISVTQESCVLSGGWLLASDNHSEISDVLGSKLLITVGNRAALEQTLKMSGNTEVNFRDFLMEAKQEVDMGWKLFEEFRAEDPKKRKNLVEPNFFDWPEKVDLNNAASELEEFGLMKKIQGTDPKFEKVLAAARLTKFLIEKWLNDESERKSKKYYGGVDPDISVLPKVWMS